MNELDIFSAALELADVAARSRYLDEACGDRPELRERMEALLRNAAHASQFLESPAPGIAATIDRPPLELPGIQIGPYKLLEQIGEGGMGVVYVASQREPIRRTVALKIIKPGMDTREVVARFEAERQALAMMDHPNIAKVFDGGVTDAGRPYFAMELVKGKPITQYCDREQLSTRERLALFVAVCQGVQHAHQKGIIHRDLKPSNLLIKVYDVRPVPMVIDFGIAKALGQQLSAQSLHTAFDQMMGTPLYMSPEQAGQSGLDVDTRSDIYSLGVLLYELLTGYTPFERDTLRTAGVDEMRRIIREVEPPRPSARVSTLQAADLSTISERRHIEPRKLSQQLRGDLDWIVMKALDKDRDRRYESASALANDVQRYLDDEPVQARPPSLAHHAAKWVRRHRPLVWAAAATLFIAIVGSLGSAFLIAKAYTQEKEQREIADKQRVLAKQQEERAKENAARAEKNYQTAREAVKQMLTRVADEQVGAIPEMKEVRRRLLEDAAAFYTELLKLNPRDAVAYFERGEVYVMLARYKEVLADFEKAVELNADNAAFHMRLGTFLRKYCPDVAYRDAKHALVHAKRAAELDPRNVPYQGELARTYAALGELGEAKATLDRATRMAPESADDYTTVAVHYNLIGDAKAALACLEKAIALDRSILDRSIYCRRTLADVLRQLGERERALAETDKAYELMLKLPFFFDDFTWVAEAFAELGEDEKALAVISKAIENNPKPNDPTTFNLYILRGDLYTARQMYASALADYDKSIELGPFRSFTYKRRAEAHFRLKNYAQSLADIAKAVELSPGDGSNIWWIPPEQVVKCPDARLREGLLKLADQAIEKTQGAAESYAARAMLYDAFGRGDEARIDFDKALQLDPKDAGLYQWRASVHAQHARWNEVVADLSKFIESNPEQAVYWYQRSLARLGGRQAVEYRQDCGAMLQRFGHTEKSGDVHWVAWACALAPDAITDWTTAIALAEKAIRSDPKSATYLNTLGAVLYRAGRFDEALNRLSEAAALVQEPSETSNSSPAYTWFFLAMTHHRLGHTEEAKQWLDRAVAWTDKTFAEADQGTVDLPWNRRLTLTLLRDEATTLLSVTSPAVEPVPEPAAKVEEAKESSKSTPAPEPAKEEEKPK